MSKSNSFLYHHLLKYSYKQFIFNFKFFVKHNLVEMYELTVFDLQLFFVTRSQFFKKIKFKIHNRTESVQPMSGE